MLLRFCVATSFPWVSNLIVQYFCLWQQFWTPAMEKKLHFIRKETVTSWFTSSLADKQLPKYCLSISEIVQQLKNLSLLLLLWYFIIYLFYEFLPTGCLRKHPTCKNSQHCLQRCTGMSLIIASKVYSHQNIKNVTNIFCCSALITTCSSSMNLRHFSPCQETCQVLKLYFNV